MSQRLNRILQFLKTSECSSMLASEARRNSQLTALFTASAEGSKAAGFTEAAASFAADLRQLTLSDLGAVVTVSTAQQYHVAATMNMAFDIAPRLLPLTELETPIPRSKPWQKFTHGDRLGCATLLHTPLVSVSAFLVPPKSQVVGRKWVDMPLHDHPGMTIWQKVLCGSMDIVSLDWKSETKPASASSSGSVGNRQAVVVKNGVLREGDAGVIRCDGGGVLHTMRSSASSCLPTVFIDIITPPYYTPPHNTACTYYEIPQAHEDDIWACAVGSSVTLTPRKDFGGPDMDAFVPVVGS